jgi:hypothetical protein
MTGISMSARARRELSLADHEFEFVETDVERLSAATKVISVVLCARVCCKNAILRDVAIV